MTSPRETSPEHDAFLSELERVSDDQVVGQNAGELEGGAAELGLIALCEGLAPVAPAPELRSRLLAAASGPTRLARFADQVAELLDVGLDKAHELLARIDDPAAWTPELPGIWFLWVEGGPRVAAAVRGFVRVQAGLDFPEHEHLGDEVTLVLQGGFEDTTRQREFRAGAVDHMPKGSVHGLRALGGVDLLKLAVVQTGLCALGHTYLPR